MVDDLLLLVAKLWGSFINEASNTHYDVNVPLTFNNLYLAISLDISYSDTFSYFAICR